MDALNQVHDSAYKDYSADPSNLKNPNTGLDSSYYDNVDPGILFLLISIQGIEVNNKYQQICNDKRMQAMIKASQNYQEVKDLQEKAAWTEFSGKMANGIIGLGGAAVSAGALAGSNPSLDLKIQQSRVVGGASDTFGGLCGTTASTLSTTTRAEADAQNSEGQLAANGVGINQDALNQSASNNRTLIDMLAEVARNRASLDRECALAFK